MVLLYEGNHFCGKIFWLVYSRFRDKLGNHVVEEFNKLKQAGPIEDYLEKFEKLKPLMLRRILLHPIIILLTFYWRIGWQYQALCQSFKPKTSPEAIKYDRLQEATIQALKILENQNPLPIENPFTQRFTAQSHFYRF